MARHTGRMAGLALVIKRINKPAYGWTEASLIRLLYKIRIAVSAVCRRVRAGLTREMAKDASIIRTLLVNSVPVAFTKISYGKVVRSTKSTVSRIRNLQRISAGRTTEMAGKIQ